MSSLISNAINIAAIDMHLSISVAGAKRKSSWPHIFSNNLPKEATTHKGRYVVN
jgi:hypothetical protein